MPMRLRSSKRSREEEKSDMIDIKGFYTEVSACTKCRLSEGRNTVVFGEGSLDADIMFVGEGPGQREDETARPFVGPAGQLLDRMLGDIGLKRSEVYIANVVKCRPPKNRNPLPDEVQACLPYLRTQVAVIKPKIIVCLGKVAAKALLGRDVSMTREHGVFLEKGRFYMMVTFHPAALLRNADFYEYSKEDFRLLKEKYLEIKDD